MNGQRLAMLRFGVSFLAGVLAKIGATSLAATSVSSRLDLEVLVSFATGLVFGPAGIGGFFLAFLLSSVEPGTSASGLLSYFILACGYALVGTIAYATFRFGKRLRCTLIDLRSYLAFVGAVLAGSLAMAAIGSSQLFLKQYGASAFWNGVVIWFSSSATTLLIAGPLVILGLCCLLPRRILKLDPGLSTPVWSEREGRPNRQNLVRIGSLVIGVTLVVIPLVRYQPKLHSWLMLLYLIPVLWASVRQGMQIALLTASASGILYLAGTELWALIDPGSATHESILAEYAALVMIALIGAITGGFQKERLDAEKALRASKSELETRSESLELVNRLTDRLHRTLNVRSIAAETVAALDGLAERPLTAFYLLDETGEYLDLIADEGYDEEAIRRHSRLRLSDSLSGLAIRWKELMVLENPAEDKRVSSAARETLGTYDIGTMVLIPLIFEGLVLGSLNLAFPKGRNLAPLDLATLQAIGHTVALAIVNARQLTEMRFQAHHDPLTGLPNRLELHRVFAELLDDNPEGRRIGLALLDLDRFKEVNDALGHRTGDVLLKRIAKRLDSGFDPHGPTAYRLGGDEFSLVLPDVRGPVEAESLVNDVLADLKRPYEVDGMRLEVSTSAGVAVYPEHGLDSHELLRSADVAMYQAKNSPSGVVVYSPEFDQHTPQRLRLASQLGDAICSDQLILHYQPKVELAGGATVGFEALARWRHPRLGVLLPNEFIPLAEVSDLIHPLTDWVMRSALKQLAAWSDQLPGLTMAVNLSARSLLDLTFPDRLSGAIEDAGVRAADVQMELTETALLTDRATSVRTLGRLSEIGVGIAIDDFGTGYSSLALLKGLSIQALKIDRSFVADLLKEEQSRAIVEATIQLARNLGVEVIAEGVESRETAEALLAMGCDLAQGFHFARPAPAEGFEL